ncbi:MAG: O-methyltransferase [Candidatus Pacebacteria bacterium]|nr:O-methyltransferase [Candidatus Paceibacterota bacterium]
MQKLQKKIKKIFLFIKIRLARLFKNIHPLSIRRDLKYTLARSRGGYINVDKNLKEYVDSLIRFSESAETNYIIRSTEKGERSYLSVPLSQARFLEVFMRSINAKHVLEIGTFRGFSTAFIARGLQEGGLVFSCDEDSRPIPAARRFWQAMGIEGKVHFEFGIATKVLEKLTSDTPSLNFFDAIFIDADKENYKHYFIESMKLLKPGGVILIDNTLWKGLVQYPNSHDNSAEHMKNFNTWIFKGTAAEECNFGFTASFVPAWDGLIMVFKNRV